MAGITPWATGQTLPTWVISLADDNNNVVNLTGATSAALSFIRGASNVTVGAGVAAVYGPPANGQVSYAPAAADVTTPGTFQIFVQVTFPTGVLTSDPMPWILVQS
jgi:hypothetical protein